MIGCTYLFHIMIQGMRQTMTIASVAMAYKTFVSTGNEQNNLSPRNLTILNIG